ncbi:hypothetical protein AB6809_29620 [Paraburkholderia sp. RCC_158]|uniref:hypothetical protein n=1 Tax=Paraburkholderia sp. RCC_158 TaxID=3239220 RepID=UPI00352475A0
MKKFLMKLLRLTRQPELPADHTWSQESIREQRAIGEAEEAASATEGEINKVIEDARAFIATRSET